MQRICQSLHKAGYKILLVGRQWPDSKPLVPQIYLQHRLICFFNKGKLFYLEYNIRLFWFLLKNQPDAYGAVDLDTALPVYLKATLAQKPFIFDAHEYFPEMPEVIRRPFIKKIWEQVEKFILARRPYAYTVSNSIAQIFERKYGTTCAVIRNLPVKQELVPFIKGAGMPYLLYQGAVNEGRGLENLLIAMQQVNMPLVICGEGDLLNQLKRQAQDLKIAHKIIFKGYVLPADLILITRQAYIGIMLLANQGLSYFYSLSNKFFDYMQAGIPQILTNFPEYRQINEQYQVGLPTGPEPEKIAANLNLLIRDKDLYNTLAANSRKAAEELNWQQEEKKLLQFYEKIWI